QTIEELNLHRESATTLRNEARVARERVEAKTREFEILVAQMEPLKGRIGELEGELEAKQAELELLGRDREHWRERTQKIISQYDRVDPVELENLKASLEALQTEKAGLELELAPLKEKVEGHGNEVTEYEGKLEEQRKANETKMENFKTQAKEQNRRQNEAKGKLVM
ncbi:Protein mlp1, partial [Teratosphaeriaceae sp. CCFEE 6253]